MTLRDKIKKIAPITPIALLAASLLITNFSCKKNQPPEPCDDPFDRAGMLNNICDNYIVPAYTNFGTAINAMEVATTTFNNTSDVANLLALRNSWLDAMEAWQYVGYFEFGPAADVSLRSQVNIYPADTSEINNSMVSGTYNLELPDSFDSKGFQALDYLLHLPGKTEQEIADYYNNSANAKNYLVAVVNDLSNATSGVINNWSTYSTTFKNNNESNAQGSSVSNLMNSISKHYETFVRKGKVGLPVGAFNGFSQLPMPELTECYYSGHSSRMCIKALDALNKIISGIDINTGTDGLGIDDYLNFNEAQYNNTNLSVAHSTKINDAISGLENLQSTLSNEVVNNNATVMAIYQDMQQLVSMTKVEITSSLGVLITYQDSDGD